MVMVGSTLSQVSQVSKAVVMQTTSKDPQKMRFFTQAAVPILLSVVVVMTE